MKVVNKISNQKPPEAPNFNWDFLDSMNVGDMVTLKVEDHEKKSFQTAIHSSARHRKIRVRVRKKDRNNLFNVWRTH